MKTRLKEIRKMRNLTQKELADMVDINRATISKYENGEIDPPINKLYDLAYYLDVSIYDLIPGMEENKDLINNCIEEGWESFQETMFFDHGYTFSDDEIRLIEKFCLLNQKGQKEAIKRIGEMSSIGDYLLADKEDNKKRRIILSTGYGCTSSTPQEKPPEGPNNPNDGQ